MVVNALTNSKLFNNIYIKGACSVTIVIAFVFAFVLMGIQSVKLATESIGPSQETYLEYAHHYKNKAFVRSWMLQQFKAILNHT